MEIEVRWRISHQMLVILGVMPAKERERTGPDLSVNVLHLIFPFRFAQYNH